MGVPMVKNCCFCVSLQTGTLIIGYLYTALHDKDESNGASFLLEEAERCSKKTPANLHKQSKKEIRQTIPPIQWWKISLKVFSFAELIGISLLVTLTPLGTEGKVSMHKYALYVTAAVVSGIHLLCSILLIVATYKKLSFLTLPWTILTGILTAAFFLMCLTGVSLILQDAGNILTAEAAFIAVHLTRSCISVYCIIVVHSRHKEIMQEEDDLRFRDSAMYKAVATNEHIL